MRSKALARRPSLPQHNALGVEWGTTTCCCQELHVYFVSCSLRKWPKPSHAQIDPHWLEKRIMFCFLLHDLLHEMHHAPCTSIQSDILTTQTKSMNGVGCEEPTIPSFARRMSLTSCCLYTSTVYEHLMQLTRIDRDRQEHLLTRMEHGSWLDLKSEICVFQMKCKNRHKFHEFRWNWPPWPAVGHGGRSWKCEEFGQSIWTNCNVCNWLYDCISSYIISIHISYIIIYILYILYT